MTRVCGKCQSEKPTSEFPTNRSWGNWCIECVSKYRRDYRARNREHVARCTRLWRLNNPDKHFNSRMIKQGIKITFAEYNGLLDRQGGVCAICHRPETAKQRGTTRRLAVDHDHATGSIRGLLCDICNRGLGFFKDDRQLLRNALYYLEAENH